MLPTTLEELIKKIRTAPESSFDPKRIEKASRKSRKRYDTLLKLSEKNVRNCETTYGGIL